MDPGEIVEDHSESSIDHNGRSIHPSGDPREGPSGVRGGGSSQVQSLEGKGAKQRDHSHHNSGAEQQDAIQHVARVGTGAGSSGIEIRSENELQKAMMDSILYLVKGIDLNYQTIPGSGDCTTLAKALASGQMFVFERLVLKRVLKGGALADDYFEKIGNALTSGKFPSLTRIEFNGPTDIGAKGVEALGRANQSGNLQKLTVLELDNLIH
ncbi:unnamed protein product [Calypogeia fissa]